MEPVLDFLGKPIKAGDTIVYPCRKGSAMWLSTLVVEHIDKDGIGGHNSAGRRINLTNLANVVVI